MGPSLGVVELAVALHYVFDTPRDNLIWDVGHQAYVHKIITGRKDKFHTNRQLHGLSGFPSIKENKYDAFGYRALLYIYFSSFGDGSSFTTKGRDRQMAYSP